MNCKKQKIYISLSSTANPVEDDEYSAEKWNEVMQDFTPDDILTFDVEAWGQEAIKIYVYFLVYYKHPKISRFSLRK